MPKTSLWTANMKKLIALIACLVTSNVSIAIEVGDMAPEFALPGSDGKIHQLKDYRGRVVVLAWFPKAFTGG